MSRSRGQRRPVSPVMVNVTRFDRSSAPSICIPFRRFLVNLLRRAFPVHLPCSLYVHFQASLSFTSVCRLGAVGRVVRFPHQTEQSKQSVLAALLGARILKLRDDMSKSFWFGRGGDG